MRSNTYSEFSIIFNIHFSHGQGFVDVFIISIDLEVAGSNLAFERTFFFQKRELTPSQCLGRGETP